LVRRHQKGGTDMAAPRFSTFRPVHWERPRRRFTLQEANRSLPLVTRIVRDVVNTHRRAMQLQAKLEAISPSKDIRALQEQLETMLERLQDYIHELDEIGVELKDYETGLIDFPGRHQGRDVYLCWKMGEEQVEYWHELHTGFAGRQPASTLQETPDA
jgi:hypothetical protein